tara:strand:+ start:727 stop:1185 length:459 start_codon:yes stop_codon:yes gene_type:complete
LTVTTTHAHARVHGAFILQHGVAAKGRASGRREVIEARAQVFERAFERARRARASNDDRGTLNCARIASGARASSVTANGESSREVSSILGTLANHRHRPPRRSTVASARRRSRRASSGVASSRVASSGVASRVPVRAKICMGEVCYERVKV